MVVKHVRDKEGRTYAIPDHILEDFEISAAGGLTAGRSRGGSTPGTPMTRLAGGGFGGGGFGMGGYDDPFDPGDLIDPDPDRVINVLHQFLGSIRVNTTLGQLAFALQLHKTLGRSGAASGRSGTSSVARMRIGGSGAMGGYDDGFGGFDDVDEILAMLSNPAMGHLPIEVTLAAVRQLMSQLANR